MPPASKINLKDKYEDGEIDLSMCDLETVPVKEIAIFKKAYGLDLSNNRLSILPKNFIILTNITKLDLSKNELKELPENFGELNKLKHLDLYRNQLKHLPLSFSKLKALKWLDLKDNPLVPAIAEAAGPCLDGKQCQQCAKDIVVFYTKLEEKVEHERMMRDKQRQKDLLANELAQQKQKQQEKKNKKKEKAKQKQQNLEETNSLSSTQDNKPKKGTHKTKKDKKVEKPSSLIVKFIKFISFALFLSLSLLFVLTSINFTHTRFIEHKVQEIWNNILSNLCPDVHPYAAQVGQFVQNVHSQTGLFIMKVAEYISALQNSNPIYKRLVEVYRDIFDTSNFYEDTLE